MKVNKMISIDVEIMRKLSETDNASALINRLLAEHFEISGKKKQSLTETKEIYLKNYLKKAKEVKNEVKVLRKVEGMGIDVRAIRWLRGHGEVPGTFAISQYRRGRGIKATIDQFREAYNLIEKHGDLFEAV